ncbi:hypothetical protein Tco_0123960, partial [Tanacetum coccineum]
RVNIPSTPRQQPRQLPHGAMWHATWRPELVLDPTRPFIVGQPPLTDGPAVVNGGLVVAPVMAGKPRSTTQVVTRGYLMINCKDDRSVRGSGSEGSVRGSGSEDSTRFRV